MTPAMTDREPPSMRVPPVVPAALASGMQHALAGKHGPTRASGAEGVVVLAGSAWLISGSVARFRRQGTTVNPAEVGADSLVTSGPNRLTRNPMYVGMAAVLVAQALARRSVPALIPAALFVVVIDRVQIPAEEAMLCERFGGEFERYASATPRWLALT